MDSMRFGRALGTGAREAAKALISAADAASSPKPEAGVAARPAADFGQVAARKAAEARRTGKGVREGSRRFGQAMWGPFARLSGIVWLEVMGVFFALFAGFAGVWAWNMRPGQISGHDSGHAPVSAGHFGVALAMAVVFGYFSASNFVKANRRGRQ